MKIARFLVLAPLALLPSQCAPAVAHAAPEAAAPAASGAPTAGPTVDVWISDAAGGGTRSFTVRAPLRDRGETLVTAQDGTASYRLAATYLEGEREVRLKIERNDRDPVRAIKLEAALPFKPGERRLAGRVQREDGTVTEVTMLAR